MTMTETQAPAIFTCPDCQIACRRFGRHRNGLQRYRCANCSKTYTEEHKAAFRVADYLNDKRGQMAIKLLVEGCSIRSVERITELRRDTVIDLLRIAGERCEYVMSQFIRDIPVSDVQADEMWGFIGKKQKNTTVDDADEFGDCYCWVAMKPERSWCYRTLLANVNN